MDGTLLDLHYDNTVWNRIVPEAYASQTGMAPEAAAEHLLAHMREVQGTIDFYCFDYWREFTGLDLVELHRQVTHLVQYRPGALAFLRWLRDTHHQVVIATNAHWDSVAVKSSSIDIAAEVDLMISSHDYKAPKESQPFWQALQDDIAFDPQRAFFADDNQPVLDSAAEFGVAHLRCIHTPDSKRPYRQDLNYPAFDHFADICAACLDQN